MAELIYGVDDINQEAIFHKLSSCQYKIKPLSFDSGSGDMPMKAEILDCLTVCLSLHGGVFFAQKTQFLKILKNSHYSISC